MARRSRLAVRREACGWTQETLAHQLGVHRTTTWRWEEGLSNPQPPQRPDLAEALQVSLDGLDDLLMPDDQQALMSTATVADVDRRQFLGAAGALGVGAALTPVFAAPKDVPPELAGYFADQLRTHVAADTRLGARPLLETVATQYRTIREAVAVARPVQRKELLGVAVGYADFSAWLYQDLGDLGQAARWCDETLRLAHRTGDPDLVAVALASMTFVHTDTGDGAGAVDLSDAARDHAGPGARSYVLWQAAHANSLAGNSHTVDRIIDDIDEITPLDPRAAWWWAGTSSTDRLRATCYVRLGRSTEAAELWAGMLDSYPVGQRNRGGALARYATALFDIDGPQAALAPAAEAVECLDHAGSARMRRDLAMLRDMAKGATSTPAGRHLNDVLHAV